MLSPSLKQVANVYGFISTSTRPMATKLDRKVDITLQKVWKQDGKLACTDAVLQVIGTLLSLGHVYKSVTSKIDKSVDQRAL